MKEHKKHLLVIGIAALLMGSSLGLNLNTVGVYLKPIATSLGIGSGDISMHSTLISLGMAFAAFLIPPVLERVHFKWVVLIATLFTSGATFLMSFSTEIWIFNILGLIRGMSAAFYGIVALQLLINNWFISRHGVVTSIVFSFSGVMGAVFTPILSGVIQNQGWQSAFVVQAILVFIFNLPGMILPYTFKPEYSGLRPYIEKEKSNEMKQDEGTNIPRKPYAFRSVTFGAILLFSIFIPALPGLVQHLAGIGVDFGFSATIGAFMISACMIGNILFKLVIGTISDKKGAVTAILSMVGVVMIGLMLILIANAEATILAGSFLLGAVYSVAAVGLSLMVKYLYAPMEFPRVFPIVNFTSNIGSALAVSIYGFIYDLTGGYELAMIGSIMISFVSIGLLLMANRISQTKDVK